MELEVGSLVGHVRLVRLLGRGGMGEVWEGFDQRLERRVAIKTIHQRRRSEPGSRERFLREARLLSQLDHPNVCRVFDLIEGRDTDFLVLELVEGESLKAHRELSLDRILALAEQIAWALAAAHARRIVHRDLKPDNVMVTPTGVVKILDFGIARLAGPLGADADGSGISEPVPPFSEQGIAQEPDLGITLALPRLASLGGEGVERRRGQPPDQIPTTLELGAGSSSTAPGSVLGTLRYMSPEQAAGEPVAESTDLYAFGVLLQELVTGVNAYESASDLLALRERVERGALDPILRDNLDPELVGLIGELTALEAGRRPTAEEAAARLSRLRSKPERQRRRRLAVAAAALLVAALGTTAWITERLSRSRPLLELEARPVRLAVLPVESPSDDTAFDWAEHGLQQILAAALQQSSLFVVASPEGASDTLARFDLEPSLVLEAPTLARLVPALASDLVVASSLRPEQGRIRLDYTIYDAGGPLRHGSVVGDEPVGATFHLAARLAHELHPEHPPIDLEGTFSRDPFANQSFAIGVQRARTTGAAAAEPYFHVSLDRDPTFALARLRLAGTRLRLGDRDSAFAIATEVAADARGAGDLQLELEAVRQLAELAQEQGDYTTAEQHLARTFELLEHTPNREIEVRARTHLGVLRYRRDELDAARAELERGLELARANEFTELEPPLLTPLAYVALRQGDRSRAAELFRHTFELARRLGHREWQAGALTNLGSIQLQDGDLAGAAASITAAREHFDHLQSARGLMVTATNLGAVHLHQGELGKAAELTDEARRLAHELGDRRSEAFALAALGYIGARRSDFQVSRARLGEATGLASTISDRELSWLIARNTAFLESAMGEPGNARRHLDEALAIKRDGLTMVVEALVTAAEGDPARAAAVLGDARVKRDMPWSQWHTDLLVGLEQAAGTHRARGPS